MAGEEDDGEQDDCGEGSEKKRGWGEGRFFGMEEMVDCECVTEGAPVVF